MSYILLTVQSMEIYMLLMGIFLKQLHIMCYLRIIIGEGCWHGDITGVSLIQWHVPEAAMCNDWGGVAVKGDDWHVPEAAMCNDWGGVAVLGR